MVVSEADTVVEAALATEAASGVDTEETEETEVTGAVMEETEVTEVVTEEVEAALDTNLTVSLQKAHPQALVAEEVVATEAEWAVGMVGVLLTAAPVHQMVQATTQHLATQTIARHVLAREQAVATVNLSAAVEEEEEVEVATEIVTETTTERDHTTAEAVVTMNRGSKGNTERRAHGLLHGIRPLLRLLSYSSFFAKGKR